MRKNLLLDALFPKIRQGVLAVMLGTPERWWYLSDLARHLGVTPSSLQRELVSLTQAGVFQTRQEGNRVYYQPNPTCPILPELRGLFLKTAALADVLKEALQPFSTAIDFAFVYGSVARQEEASGSDIDLMIVGELRLAEVVPALCDAEKRLLRPINPSLFTRDEFIQKAQTGNHFITSVLQAAKIFLQGDQDELDTIISTAASHPARYESP